MRISNIGNLPLGFKSEHARKVGLLVDNFSYPEIDVTGNGRPNATHGLSTETLIKTINPDVEVRRIPLNFRKEDRHCSERDIADAFRQVNQYIADGNPADGVILPIERPMAFNSFKKVKVDEARQSFDKFKQEARSKFEVEAQKIKTTKGTENLTPGEEFIVEVDNALSSIEQVSQNPDNPVPVYVSETNIADFNLFSLARGTKTISGQTGAYAAKHNGVEYAQNRYGLNPIRQQDGKLTGFHIEADLTKPAAAFMEGNSFAGPTKFALDAK